MKELPLKALRVFEAVARHGSFKEAADELCVSQSAVSHQIKHLESWMGKPLFDRTGHRPVLLTHAQVLSATLQRSFQDIDSACQLAKHRTESKTLVIASIPSVAICWLIPRLAQFQAEHPDIATRVVYAFHGQDIDFNHVDLAFVFAENPPALAGHNTQLFQPGASVPVCSPALYDTLTITELSQSIVQAGLLHDSNVDGWKDWLTQTNIHLTRKITGPIFEDFNLLRAAALAGQGVALCPLALIGTDLASNNLIQLSNTCVHQNFNYYLMDRESSNDCTESISACFKTWVFEQLEREKLL